MADEGIVIKDQATWDRIVAAVRNVERLMGSQPPSSVPAETPVPAEVIVKVTDTVITDTGVPDYGDQEYDVDIIPVDGFYPGKIVFRWTEATSPSEKFYELEDNDCYVDVLNTDDPPRVEKDRYYRGRVIGIRNGMPVVEIEPRTPAGFFARLTSSSSGKWKFVRLTLDSGGSYIDDGAEVSTYSAVPLTIDGSSFATVPFAGLRVWMIPSKQIGLYEFLPIGKAPSPTGCDGDGWGWFVGLKTTECLFLEVINTFGDCVNIPSPQEMWLRWNSGESKWVSQTWNCLTPGWESKDFTTDLDASPIKFSIVQGDTGRFPVLEISGISYKLAITCGADGVMVFTGGGSTVCAVTDPPTSVECNNFFQVRLTCDCCPLFEEDGWYCVVDADQDCDVDDKTVVELRKDLGDHCRTDIIICSCRYATEAEAIAACIPPVASCCEDAIPDDLYLTLAATGGCANLNGMVIHFVRVGMTSVWAWADATGGTGGCVDSNITVGGWSCTTGDLDLVFGADNTAAAVLTAFTCTPDLLATYELTFTYSASETCCSGIVTATLTV